MTTKPAAVFALLALSLAAQSACAPPTRSTAPATDVRASSPEVVPVAPPTGERDAELEGVEGAAWYPRDPDRSRIVTPPFAERGQPPQVPGPLGFIHISPDASKRVRLLKDGKPEQWRPLAKDGADLPAPAAHPPARGTGRPAWRRSRRG